MPVAAKITKISQWREPGSTSTQFGCPRSAPTKSIASSIGGRDGEDPRMRDDPQEAAQHDTGDAEGLIRRDRLV